MAFDRRAKRLITREPLISVSSQGSLNYTHGPEVVLSFGSCCSIRGLEEEHFFLSFLKGQERHKRISKQQSHETFSFAASSRWS